jgi:hypothetical protein
MSMEILLAVTLTLLLILVIPGGILGRNSGSVPMGLLGLVLSLVLVSFLAVPI